MKTNRRRLLQALSLLPFVGAAKLIAEEKPIKDMPVDDSPPILGFECNTTTVAPKGVTEYIKISINGVDAYLPVCHADN